MVHLTLDSLDSSDLLLDSLDSLDPLAHYLTHYLTHYPTHYFTHYLTHYFESLLDSLRGFFSFYFRKKAFLYPFKYYKFDEDVIETELSNNYNWEFDDTTGTSWRIGDGTAPFYNYIYWLHAGFTENDSFRSYQVREGIITRNEALDLLKSENIPRFKRLKEYLETIDLDYDYVMSQLEKVKENSLVKNWTTL